MYTFEAYTDKFVAVFSEMRRILVKEDIGSKNPILRNLQEEFKLESKRGTSLTLRPEATASVCRAYIEHNMQQLPQPVKLYYMVPMFRRMPRPRGGHPPVYQNCAGGVWRSEAPANVAAVIVNVITFF